MPELLERKLTLLSVPLPVYTTEAWENEIWGVVVVRVMFGAAGVVDEVEVVVELSHGLSEKAAEAAREIGFLPAVKEGRAVSQRVKIGYDFNLRGERAGLVLL